MYMYENEHKHTHTIYSLPFKIGKLFYHMKPFSVMKKFKPYKRPELPHATLRGTFFNFHASWGKILHFPIVFGLCVGSFGIACLIHRSYFRNVSLEDLKMENELKYQEQEKEWKRIRASGDRYMEVHDKKYSLK